MPLNKTEDSLLLISLLFIIIITAAITSNPWNKTEATNTNDLAEDDGEGRLNATVDDASDAAKQDVLPLGGVHAHQAGEGCFGQVLFLLLHIRTPHSQASFKWCSGLKELASCSGFKELAISKHVSSS